MNYPKAPKRKMRTWKKVLIGFLITLLCLVLAAGITIFAVINHYLDKINYVPIDPDETIIDVPDETDFPDYPYPTTPDASSPGGVTPGVTDEGAEGPMDNPITSGALASIEDEIDNNAEGTYRMEFDKNITNILLIGTDGRTVQERGRSDSMILLTINRNTKQIVMTSIMRDIYLKIPGLSNKNRINAAYSSGGVNMLLNTIEENFKIKIDKYVRINFTGFEKVVDQLGGLDIKLSQAEINFIGNGLKAKPGIVHLNGAQTLRFCRCRYVSRDGYGSDFARTYRQREVMTLIAQKCKGSSFSTLNDMLNDFLPQVVTNLTKSELLDLITDFNTFMNEYEIKSYQIPAKGTWNYATIRKMSVLTINFSKNTEMLEKYIRGTA